MKLRTLQEISRLKLDEGMGPVAYQIELVSIYLECSSTKARRMNVKELRNTVNNIESEIIALDKKVDKLLLDGSQLHLKTDQDLRLGEYIDIETYAKDAKIGHILAVMFRQRTGDGVMYNYEFEPYSKVNVDGRAAKFMELDADGLSAVITQTHDYRKAISESYQNLFAPVEPDTRDEGDMTESEIKLKKAEEIHAAFAWSSFVLFLADGDVTKCEAVLDLPLYFALNMASYKKSVLPKG